MNYAHYIKELGRGAQGSRDLPRDEAAALYGAMLDCSLPELELGAIIVALRVKGESLGEMHGFLDAIEQREEKLRLPPGRARPVLLPSYNGARKEANLTPLLALLLQRFGIPVLVHGLLEGYGRVTSGQIFRELRIMPAMTLAEVQQALDRQQLAFAPLSLLHPGLHHLLSLRSRMGIRNSAHSLVKLLNPFSGEALRVAPATHPDFIDLMRQLLIEREAAGLLLRGTEGEAYANPKRRPRLEMLLSGQSTVLFEAEHESLRALPHLPESADAARTADWIRRVLERQIPLPQPIANQLAACLHACGYASDLNQAKAMVAVEACANTTVGG